MRGGSLPAVEDDPLLGPLPGLELAPMKPASRLRRGPGFCERNRSHLLAEASPHREAPPEAARWLLDTPIGHPVWKKMPTGTGTSGSRTVPEPIPGLRPSLVFLEDLAGEATIALPAVRWERITAKSRWGFVDALPDGSAGWIDQVCDAINASLASS